MSKLVAIIQFPGSNCEYETLRSVEYYGLEAEIVRWNCPPEELSAFSAYILPGGFSYQDRVRAGAIAARLPLLEVLKAEAQSGKPILGICNGCQILAESGLISNHSSSGIDVSLSHNTVDHKPIGFICDWVFVKAQNPKHNIFTYHLDENDVIPIPINHGEGHFCFTSEADSSRSQLHYCDFEGNIKSNFPINPNGSTQNIAGFSNEAGNVFAMMPHPERATFVKQVPGWIQSDWVDAKRAFLSGTGDADGPWAKMFIALRDAVSEKIEVVSS